MGTKNIAISDEAYERLRSLKKPGESITELIERMTGRQRVADLAGLITKPEGLKMKKTVSELREANSGPGRETGGGPDDSAKP